MANESERPIEKLLSAVAKKRRDAVGPPFELHPADRRLLQDEVARKFAKPHRQGHSLAELLARLWPQLAGGVAILAVLCLTVWALLPSPRNDKAEAFLAKNMPVSKDLQVKEPLELSAPVPTTATPPAAPTARAEPAMVAYADTTSIARPIAAGQLGAAPPPVGEQSAAAQPKSEEADRLALAFARKPAQSQAPATTLLATSRETASQTPVAVPAGGPERRSDQQSKYSRPSATVASVNAPAHSSVARFGLSRAGPAPSPEVKALSVAQRFVQVPPEPKAKAALASEDARTRPVLASFQVEQAGQVLRIVDDDGSVYTGSLQLASAARRARSAKEDVPLTALGARTPIRALEQETASTFDSIAPASQTYSFRVAGTNRSLQKRVVFTGNLLTTTNLGLSLPGSTNSNDGAALMQGDADTRLSYGPTNSGIAGGLGDSPKAATRPSFLPLLNSRISGKVVVDNGKAVEINALPAKP